MWLAKSVRENEENVHADIGVVTLSGDPAGVYLDGERRSLPVYSAGGYTWRPKVGQQVLVIKTGDNQAGTYVVGTAQDDTQMEAGEVVIQSDSGAKIHWKADGSLELTGDVYVNGWSLEKRFSKLEGQEG